MKNCAESLKLLLQEDISLLDISKSVSDFDDSANSPSNPLRQGLPLTSKNIFIDIIDYGIQNNKELIYTILKHITNPTTEFDETIVIQVSKIYMELASAHNYLNNTFNKLRGTFLGFRSIWEYGAVL